MRRPTPDTKRKTYSCQWTGCRRRGEYGFTSKRFRRQHILSYHNSTALYPCDALYCQRNGRNAFRRKYDLKSHKQIFHSDDESESESESESELKSRRRWDKESHAWLRSSAGGSGEENSIAGKERQFGGLVRSKLDIMPPQFRALSAPAQCSE